MKATDKAAIAEIDAKIRELKRELTGLDEQIAALPEGSEMYRLIGDTMSPLWWLKRLRLKRSARYRASKPAKAPKVKP